MPEKPKLYEISLNRSINIRKSNENHEYLESRTLSISAIQGWLSFYEGGGKQKKNNQSNACHAAKAEGIRRAHLFS
jgi:hypothetical protein